MKSRTDPEEGAALAQYLVRMFGVIGEGLGLALYRVILSEDGKGEAEFSAINPVECQVLKWDGPEELKDLIAQAVDKEIILGRSVFRKKCTKCLLHERPVMAAGR